MTEIRAIYHNGDPGFPATDQHPNAIRYAVGTLLIDAVGGEPTQYEIDIALNPSIAPTAANVRAEAARRISVVTFGGVVFGFCDSAGSDKNIAGAGTLALAAIIAGAQPGNLRWADPGSDFCWIALNNTRVNMDAHTCLAFAQTAAVWKTKHMYAARALKDMSPIPADYASDSRWPSP